MSRMSVVTILLLSIVPPAIMTYIGLTHNAMMEFCLNDPEIGSECVIDTGYVVGIFSTWYIFSFVLIMILFYIFKFARMNLNKIFRGVKNPRL